MAEEFKDKMLYRLHQTHSSFKNPYYPITDEYMEREQTYMWPWMLDKRPLFNIFLPWGWDLTRNNDKLTMWRLTYDETKSYRPFKMRKKYLKANRIILDDWYDTGLYQDFDYKYCWLLEHFIKQAQIVLQYQRFCIEISK